MFRLYTQCMQAMEVCCSVWGPIVLRLLVSAAPKVCTQALDEIKMYESAFVRSKDCIKACTGVLSYVSSRLLTVWDVMFTMSFPPSLFLI